MIRILHIVSKLSINSGVMNVIMNYYRYIDRDKIQFDFLYFENKMPDFKEEIRSLGGNIYYVNKPALKGLSKTFHEFNEFFRNHSKKYAAIHLHEIYLVHFLAFFCKKYGINHLITHAHTTQYSDNPKNAIRNRFMCIGLKHSATDYFACSKAAGSFYYGSKTIDSGNVKIINNAIDIEKYKFNKEIRNRVRTELNIENKFVIGHIGRMAYQKNQIFLLRIFGEVKKRIDNAFLLMVGDGPLRKDLEREILRLGLEKEVMLLGVRNDVPSVLMAMDVFVLPSLFEGLPVSVVEAQATGLKCILSNTITQEVDIGKNIYLDLECDVFLWVSNILSQYGNKRKEFSDSALKESAFAIDSCCKALEKYYLNM